VDYSLTANVLPPSLLQLYEIPDADSRLWLAAIDADKDSGHYRIYYRYDSNVEHVPMSLLLNRYEHPGHQYTDYYSPGAIVVMDDGTTIQFAPYGD